MMPISREVGVKQKIPQERVACENVRRVLLAILTAKKASKARLAAETGISLMSISRICDELIDLGLIREVDDTSQRPLRSGRPPKKVTLLADSLLCCGVYLGKRMLHMGIVNPYGCVLEKKQVSFPEHGSFVPDQVLPWVAEQLKTFLACWRGRGLLREVGVSVTGIVDEEKGTLEFSANLKWKDCGITRYLHGQLPEFDFSLENDTKALAQAEYFYGASAGVGNIVVLTLDDGIGSAAVLDGKVYRARRNMAGEIGHIILNPNGKACECGQVGCLQTYLAKNVILNEAQRMYPGINLRDLVRKSQNNEPFASALINQVVDYASVAINLLANMYSPQVICLSGSTIWDSPVLRDMIEKNYKNKLSEYLCDSFLLKFDSFGPDAYFIGGAAAAFSHVLERMRVVHV